jgi:hypothetical protein
MVTETKLGHQKYLDIIIFAISVKNWEASDSSSWANQRGLLSKNEVQRGPLL